jgi:hypothetical protein
MVAEAQVEDIRERYESGERVAIRVPLWVQQTAEEPRLSYFDVYLRHEPEIRNGKVRNVHGGV